MATPLSADNFLKYVRNLGVSVTEHTGWRTHNRAGHGNWGPVNGVMMHHTGPYASQAQITELCYSGRSDLPGPLCHGVITKDGTLHMVGWGRANHAGGGDPHVLDAVIHESYTGRPPAPHEHEGSAGAVDGNAHFYGFELVNRGNGKESWPAAQIEAAQLVAYAICHAHGWTEKSVVGHLEWSDWKSDPAGLPMPTFRSHVHDLIKSGGKH